MPEEIFGAISIIRVNGWFQKYIKKIITHYITPRLDNLPKVDEIKGKVYLMGSYYPVEYVNDLIKSKVDTVIVLPEKIEKYKDFFIKTWYKNCSEDITFDYILTCKVFERHKNPTDELNMMIKGYYEEINDETDPIRYLLSLLTPADRELVERHSDGEDDRNLYTEYEYNIYKKWLANGSMLQKRDQRLIMNRVNGDSRKDFIFEGYKTSALPCTEFVLETKTALASLPDTDIGLLFTYSKSGGYYIKLSTVKEYIDVGKIALKYGGGGAKNNSGFFAPIKLAHELLPFLAEQSDQ